MGEVSGGREQELQQVAGLLGGLLRAGGPTLLRAGNGLTLTQTVALAILGEEDAEITVNDLAAAMRMSVPSASRAVDALHKQGLVSRLEGIRDRRQRRIMITDAGRDRVEDVWSQRVAHVPALLAAQLTARQADQLIRALAPLLNPST